MKNITINLLAFFIFSVTIVSAQSTGFMNPTDTALPHGWSTPLNGMVSDTMWATAPHQSGCRCPFVYLSWNGGATYTSSMILGPYDTVDTWQAVGGATNLWGHAWVDTEFSNANFRVKVANSSTLIEQGYRDFNFVIPSGATINGIALKMQFHGLAFTTDLLNAFQVNVFYTALTGVTGIVSAENGITIYPNPAKNTITFQTTIGNTFENIELYSLLGKMIESKRVLDNNTVTFNISHLANGLYFYRAISSNNQIVKVGKFEIQQ